MRIAIHIDADGLGGQNMDFRNPQLGNPGIGGTEYEFIFLAYALANFSQYKVNVYCNETNNLYPDGVKIHTYTDNQDLLEKVKADGNDVFVLRATPSPNYLDIFSRLKSSSLNAVAWAHNFLDYDFLGALAKNPAVKRVVMVSHEHYDEYLDHPIIAKSTYIYNMFDGRNFPLRPYPDEPAVTYTGGLYSFKGFHVLAAMWKDILREVPGATLYVIGSGKLYNKDAKLGAYGIAGEKYEAMFMKHLTEGGKILPSVKFLGVLGAEKSEIYYKTTVGVANPTGIDETFGISALDAEACGVPVVTRVYGGLFETVKHGETGYLGRNAEEIKKYIILLLKDKELNIRLGRQAKDLAEKSFLPEKIVKQWLKLFDDILAGRPCEYIPPSPNKTRAKRLRIANRWLREHYIPAPPLSLWPYAWVKLKKAVKKIMPEPYRLLKKLLGRQ